MTRATMYVGYERYRGFRIEGHNNYARAGYNIVCASISTLSQAVQLALIDILKTRASVLDSDGLLEVRWGYIPSKDDVATETLARMLHMSLNAIAEQYPSHLVVEVKEE